MIGDRSAIPRSTTKNRNGAAYGCIGVREAGRPLVVGNSTESTRAPKSEMVRAWMYVAPIARDETTPAMSTLAIELSLDHHVTENCVLEGPPCHQVAVGWMPSVSPTLSNANTKSGSSDPTLSPAYRGGTQQMAILLIEGSGGGGVVWMSPVQPTASTTPSAIVTRCRVLMHGFLHMARAEAMRVCL